MEVAVSVELCGVLQISSEWRRWYESGIGKDVQCSGLSEVWVGGSGMG